MLLLAAVAGCAAPKPTPAPKQGGALHATVPLTCRDQPSVASADPGPADIARATKRKLVAGVEQIHLPEAALRRASQLGVSDLYIHLTMCVTPDGRPSCLEFTQIGDRELWQLIVDRLEQWRYEPAAAGDTATMCFPLDFHWMIE